MKLKNEHEKEMRGQETNKKIGSRQRIKTYWKNLMASTQEKFSAGAAFIAKNIPFARKENWRRKDKR